MPARRQRTRAELEQIARTRFGYDALRPGQAISDQRSAVSEGKPPATTAGSEKLKADS
jgi:hypothetical protein